MNSFQAQNIKLRRQLREEREQTKKLLLVKLEEIQYERWVSDVNAKIAEINKAIRSTNKPSK